MSAKNLSDPFETLRLLDSPIAPSPQFALQLKARVRAGLGFAQPIPLIQGDAMPRTSDGLNTVTAYLCCRGATDAIAFYRDVFGAHEVGTRYVDQSDGRLGHAQFRIGDTTLMISDEYPDYGAVSPLTLGGTSIALTVYVDDVDTTFRVAIEAGARGVRAPEDQPYGDRAGTIIDPWGHRWTVQQVIDRPLAPMEGFDIIEATS